MRLLAAVLAALCVLIQYPLWLGERGWLRVWDLDRKLAGERAKNQVTLVRNELFDAELADMKRGFDALEERARFHLGLVKQDEVIFKYADPAKLPPSARR